MLSYVEAILRTYNEFGRRDNIYKARIKILVHELGAEAFAREVEAEWQVSRTALWPSTPPRSRRSAAALSIRLTKRLTMVRRSSPKRDAPIAISTPGWAIQSPITEPPGYTIVTLSLKPEGGTPGDATAEQMDAIADLADRYSFGEIRVGHEQNLVLPHVAQRDLPALWRALDAVGVATPNVGLVSDIISCPGLDYCNLANARSIPIAKEITRRFRIRTCARPGPAAHQHFRLHQCLRPSPCRPHRHSRRREKW